MIDVIAALQLAGTLADKQPIGTTISDITTLYGVYSKVQKAGKIDVGVMVKDGTLKPVVAALKRSTAILDAVLTDPAHGPQAVALLESITG